MMTLNNNLTKIVAATAVATVSFAPIAANAQSSHRQQTKNTWRNLGYAGGALGVLGLLSGNKTLAIAGLAGGAYSAWRYEQDRKSQSAADRRRAQLFSQRYVNYKGHRYERKTVWKNGHKYYSFVRVR